MEEVTREQVMVEVHKVDIHATCEIRSPHYLTISTFIPHEVGNHLLQEFDNVWQIGQDTVTVMILMKGDKNEAPKQEKTTQTTPGALGPAFR